jgi:hypothetical protein
LTSFHHFPLSDCKILARLQVSVTSVRKNSQDVGGKRLTDRRRNSHGPKVHH